MSGCRCFEKPKDQSVRLNLVKVAVRQGKHSQTTRCEIKGNMHQRSAAECVAAIHNVLTPFHGDPYKLLIIASEPQLRSYGD